MKQAQEWLNEVGETVMLSAFAGEKPPGIEVEQLVKRIQSDALAEPMALLERLHRECLVPDFAHDAVGSCPICRLLKSLNDQAHAPGNNQQPKQ